ncbi:hypothetical protein ABZ569_32720 [Streptomyces albus]|uniref:hypothetical protein n=1 Tax=Streptomyces albus TaxID=1888 RepID=UPI0033FEB014
MGRTSQSISGNPATVARSRRRHSSWAAPSWTVSDETPLSHPAVLNPAQREFLDFGYLTPDVAHRLVAYSEAEAAPAMPATRRP